MAYIYDFVFKVHSVIENLDDAGLAEGEPEISITSMDGFLKLDGDAAYITYKEESEGGRIISDITLTGGSCHLVRRGAVEFDVTFIEGRTEKTVYSVPPYSFDAEVRTKRIRNSISKTGGELSILYSMNIGGQEKAVRLKITAKPKARV